MLGRKTLWKSKNPHSLEYLKYLHQVLCKNQTVTESNSGLLVEALRMISEILIWGDQNDSSVIDFFLEKNMLSFFLRYMKQKSSRFICVQLLQTLNILFENIGDKTSIYYLLSNNHINSIICHKFDFSDEEVMAYYISFLKTLSFKLNKHTIHFFYNENTNDFALYTEAIKFFNHSESMVRIAVRTITLNVYKVEDKAMLRFIRDKTAVPYFSNLVWFIGNHILEINSCVKKDADHNSRGRLEDLVAEHLDHLHYLNDILSLQIPELNDILCNHLMNRLLLPLYVCSLLPASELTGSFTFDSEANNPRVDKGVALFLLSQVYLILHHSVLSLALAAVIFRGYVSHSSASEIVAPKLSHISTSVDQKLNSLALSSNTPQINTKSVQSLHISPKHASEWGFIAPDNSLSHMLEQTRGENRPNLIVDKEGMIHRIRRTNSHENDVIHSAQDGSSSSTSSLQLIYSDDVKVDQLIQLIVASGTISIDPLTSETDPSYSFSDSREKLFPFLTSIYNALDCSVCGNDYQCLFAICLLYGLYTNRGMTPQMVKSLFYSAGSEGKSNYNSQLVERLINVVAYACKPNSPVRLATLEMAIALIKQLVMENVSTIIVGNSSYNLSDGEKATMDSDETAKISSGLSYLQDRHLALLEEVKEESLFLLRNYYKSEEIFLDMFEDEYYCMHCRPINVEYLLMDATLLLKPAETPLSGIEFTRRLPSGDAEHTRRAIRVFLQLRGLSNRLRGEEDVNLPLDRCMRNVELEDKLDLRNSDLIACTVLKDSKKERRFLVVDYEQMILVEPDSKRLGWGVVTFVGHLQHVEISPNPDDTRSLFITVRRAPNPSPSHRAASAAPRNKLLSSVKFIFDDHIRCNAAKQRLVRGRERVLHQKMLKISRLLELPTELYGHGDTSYFKSMSTIPTGFPSNRSSQQQLNQMSHETASFGGATFQPIATSLRTMKAYQDQQSESTSTVRRWLENVDVQSATLLKTNEETSDSSVPTQQVPENAESNEEEQVPTDGSDSGVAEPATNSELPTPLVSDSHLAVDDQSDVKVAPVFHVSPEKENVSLASTHADLPLKETELSTEVADEAV